MKILLITGWGLGTAVLDDFAEKLRAHHEVVLWDIFDPNVEDIWNEKIKSAHHFDVLMGWSLGGQLALLLADEIAERTKKIKPVIACMSNPCFVAHDNWPTAMPSEQFDQFHASAEQDMVATLERFCSLVTLGSATPRKHTKLLQQQLSGVDLHYQKKHLYLLGTLNLVNLLKAYQGKTLFIFADQDALVPCHVAQEPEMRSIYNVSVENINGGHDAILFDPSRVIKLILYFLTSINPAA